MVVTSRVKPVYLSSSRFFNIEIFARVYSTAIPFGMVLPDTSQLPWTWWNEKQKYLLATTFKKWLLGCLFVGFLSIYFGKSAQEICNLVLHSVDRYGAHSHEDFTASFSMRTPRELNTQSIFPITYNLGEIKATVNRHFLTDVYH